MQALAAMRLVPAEARRTIGAFPIRGLRLGCAILVCAGALAPAALAQSDYPSQTVRIVVPLPPGATADTLPRAIGDQLARRWSRPVVIENRPGAAQNLGAEVVARAKPDGHTLLATPQGPLVISQSFYAKLAFDPAAFTPIAVMATAPYVLVARSDAPFSTLPEMIAFARANPSKLNYAHPGSGSSTHLGMEWLNKLAGIDSTPVPYQGAAPALAALLGGQVDVMFDNLGNVLPNIRDHRLKALAVGDAARTALLPDTPAVAEFYPDYQMTAWFAIVAPPNTPPDVARAIAQGVGAALGTPEVATILRAASADPGFASPERTARFIGDEAARWRRVIDLVGLKPE